MKKSVLLVSLWVVFSPTNGWAEVVNRIVATVDGEPITLHELRSFAKQVGQRNLLMAPEGTAGMSDRDLLDAIIMDKLITKEVEVQGLKALDSDIDSYIARIKTQENLDDEQLEAALAQQGLTMAGYRQQIAQEIERALLVNREIGSRVNVTPEDIERYYQAHADEYRHPDQVRVRHIFLPLSPLAGPEEEQAVLALVEDIRTRALAGEDFAALATTYSLGPGADEGGDLGFFKKGEMTPEIEEVAFALETGDISQPFRTTSGVHILKVEERHAAGQQAIESVSEEIKRKLYNEALRERYQRWFQEDLRFRHHVENLLTSPTGSSYSGISSTSADGSNQTVVTPGNGSPPEAGEEPQEEERGFFRRLLPF